jgi:hypothetical protein
VSPPRTDHDFKIAENSEPWYKDSESSRLYQVAIERCEGRYLVRDAEPWHDGSLTWSYKCPEKESPDFLLEKGAMVLRLDGKIIDAIWTGEIPVLYKECVVSVHRQGLQLVWRNENGSF